MHLGFANVFALPILIQNNTVASCITQLFHKHTIPLPLDHVHMFYVKFWVEDELRQNSHLEISSLHYSLFAFDPQILFHQHDIVSSFLIDCQIISQNQVIFICKS